jgi:hypothetical protein
VDKNKNKILDRKKSFIIIKTLKFHIKKNQIFFNL